MKKEFRLAVSLLVFFVLLAALHLFIITKNIGVKYAITEVKIKLNDARSANRQVEGRITAGEDLGQVEKRAREKLGMVYPVRVNYIISSPEARPAGSNR